MPQGEKCATIQISNGLALGFPISQTAVYSYSTDFQYRFCCALHKQSLYIIFYRIQDSGQMDRSWLNSMPFLTWNWTCLWFTICLKYVSFVFFPDFNSFIDYKCEDREWNAAGGCRLTEENQFTPVILKMAFVRLSTKRNTEQKRKLLLSADLNSGSLSTLHLLQLLNTTA